MTTSPSWFDRWSGPAALLLIVVVSAMALRTGQPPAPVAAGAPDSVFSAERAMEHVRAIAAEPHAMGTPAHARAREYVMAALRSLGVEPEVQTATAVVRRGTRVQAATVHNVVARLPGARPSGAVALVSHYDSQVLTPGAADATSGVAAILETVRALRAGAPLAHDVIVLITDGEEFGLLGAEAFVAEHRWARDVALVLNFEARGSAGPSYMFEIGPRNGWLVRRFAAHDPHPVANSLAYEVYRRMPNDTDFSVFRRAGIGGLNFAFLDDAATYHQSFDTPERLARSSLQHHGEHALAMVRYFGSAELTALEGPDAVWFNVPAVGLAVYPARWAVPLAVLTAGLWLGLLVWGLRSRRMRVRDLLVGVVLVPVALVLANRGAYLMMGHLYPLHAEHDLLQGRAQHVEGWYLLAVVSLTWIPVAGLWILARHWVGAAGTALGGLLLPTALVVFVAVVAPGASVVVQWPVLCALASVFSLRPPGERPSGRRTWLWSGVLAVPTLLLLVPVLYLLFVAMSIELAPYLAVLAGILAVLLYPLIDHVRRPNWWWSLATAAGICVLSVTIGLASRGASAERPAPTALLYALDADEGVALWASGLPADDAWTRPVLGDGAGRSTLERYLPGARDTFRIREAFVVDLPSPVVETQADRIVDGVRHVTVALRSRMAAPLLHLRAPDQPQVHLTGVNGKALGSDGDDAFDLSYLGAKDVPIVIDLTSSTPQQPIVLELWEHRYELPTIDGIPGPRPATVFPAAGYWSDRTIVRRTVVVGRGVPGTPS